MCRTRGLAEKYRPPHQHSVLHAYLVLRHLIDCQTIDTVAADLLGKNVTGVFVQIFDILRTQWYHFDKLEEKKKGNI